MGCGLFFRELFRDLHRNTHHLVPFAPCPHVRHPLILQLEDSMRLGASRYCKLRLAEKGGHLYLVSESGSGERDRDLKKEVISCSFEAYTTLITKTRFPRTISPTDAS